jgi:hypothetical protein
MSINFNLFLILIFAVNLSLFAQEEEGNMNMAPPSPLEDDFFIGGYYRVECLFLQLT